MQQVVAADLRCTRMVTQPRWLHAGADAGSILSAFTYALLILQVLSPRKTPVGAYWGALISALSACTCSSL